MPTIPQRRRRRRDHRLGHRPAAQGPDQRRPRRHDGHQRRVDPRAHRHPASARSAAPPPGCRSRPGARRSRCPGVDPAAHRRARSWPPPPPTAPSRRPPPTVQNELGLRCGAFDVNAACSGFVYGLVVAHGLIAMGAEQGAGHRHRHAGPHHRLGGPQHRHPVRRRLRRRRARGGRRARASCSAGTSTPTARPSASSTPRSAATSTWTAGRSSAGPCASWSTPARSRWPTPASPPTTSTWSCPTRPTSASSRPPASASASRWSGRPRCSQHTGNTSSASIPLALVDAARQRPGAGRRPRPARRLRRRHDRGQRRAPLGRRARA